MKPNPFAIGFAQGLLHDIDGPAFDTQNKESMSFAPSSIAKAYGTARQNIDRMKRHCGVTDQMLRDPDRLFSHLLNRRASQLRSRLASPSTRAAIAEKLSLISKIETP